MEDLLKTKLVKKGEVLFREGEGIHSFYLVTRGRLALLRSNGSRNIVIKVCENRDMAGESCVFGKDNVYGNTAVALEDMEVMEINGHLAKESVAAQKPWVKSILENLSGKVENTTGLLAEHRIEDEALYGEAGLQDEDLALIKNSI